MHTPALPSRTGRLGFTLLELMVVLTIMGMIMVLALPAVKGFSGSVGRKGAINLMLSTFEQARVAALTSGTNVYVGFADNKFPQEMKYRAFIIFRDRLEGDRVYSGATPTYVALTKWIQLPKGISFKKEVSGTDYSLVSQDLDMIIPANNLPQVGPNESIPVLTFNSSGFIEATNSDHLRLLLYEGFHGPGGPNFTSPDRTSFDMIGLRKYTGRAELFLTSAPSSGL